MSKSNRSAREMLESINIPKRDDINNIRKGV